MKVIKITQDQLGFKLRYFEFQSTALIIQTLEHWDIEQRVHVAVYSTNITDQVNSALTS